MFALLAGRFNEATGDSIMAKAIFLEVASTPLSTVIGGVAYNAKERVSGGMVSDAIDYGQVLANWMLLSLIVVGIILLVRRARTASTNS
jgi:cytosine/uracil/thiamine/allantoin permease